jgi:hypothetical protein
VIRAGRRRWQLSTDVAAAAFSYTLISLMEKKHIHTLTWHHGESEFSDYLEPSPVVIRKQVMRHVVQ